MNRLILSLTLILLFALAACDTMGPKPPQAEPTAAAPAESADSPTATELPAEPAGDDAETQPGADLHGVVWAWVSLTNSSGPTDIADPTRYTLEFSPDGSLNIRADCNNARSEYITDGAGIQIMPGMTTLMACEPDSQDQLFLDSLYAAAAYVVDDDELLLTLADDGGTMLFQVNPAEGLIAPPPGAMAQSLVGVTWEWVSLATGKEVVHVAEPSRYTILFNAEGTASIAADCNTVIASYAAGEDGTMHISLGPSTLMACPADSQADLLTSILPQVALYTFIDGDLILELPVDSGSIRLRPAGAAAPAGPDPALMGVTWQWVSTTTPVEEIVPTDPAHYTIVFLEGGTAGILADCNVGNAEYSAAGGSISIVLGVTTLAYCENSQDQVFRAGLEAAAVYSFADNGDLLLDMMADSGTMRFVAAGGAVGDIQPPAAEGGGLTGTVWQLTRIARQAGDIAVDDPPAYTIRFNDDGTATFKADCNVGNMAWSTDAAGGLTLIPGPMTLAYCGAGSLDQFFLGGLTNAQSYAFEDGNLVVTMLYGSGSLYFSAAP